MMRVILGGFSQLLSLPYIKPIVKYLTTFVAYFYLLLMSPIFLIKRLFFNPTNQMGGELICAQGYNNPACGLYVPLK